MTFHRLKEDEYIDLGALLEALLRKFWLIILTGALFAAGGFAYASFIATPIYESSAMMIVNSGVREYVTQDQINSATSLVDTYSVIITSDTVMDDVKGKLGMRKTFEDEVKDVTIDSVNGTQVMEITVKAVSPETAYKVCREITKICPSVIVETVEAGSMKLVSKATIVEKPVSPDIPRVTLIAGLLGILLVSCLIILRTLMDNKIKSENELEMAGIPMLGLIPRYEMEG